MQSDLPIFWFPSAIGLIVMAPVIGGLYVFSVICLVGGKGCWPSKVAGGLDVAGIVLPFTNSYLLCSAGSIWLACAALAVLAIGLEGRFHGRFIARSVAAAFMLLGHYLLLSLFFIACGS